MIHADAKIILYSKFAVGGNAIMSGLRTTVKIGSNGYICKIKTANDDDIPLDIETNVEIEILYGEAELLVIADNCKFELVSGSTIGEGEISRIKNIIIEKETIELLDNFTLSMKILDCAQKFREVVIEDAVYEFLNEKR